MAGASPHRVPPQAPSIRRAVALCALLAFSTVLLAQGSKGFDTTTEDHNTGPARRLALVIGNKDYPWKPLANPVNDATDVAEALEKAGFKGNVQRLFNAQHDELKRAVRDFVASVHPGDFAFVYYSGHGVEVKGINYLLPIDIPANASEDEVEDDGVSAQRIANDLDDHGAAVKVIVLDACRDNPIKASRSAGGGLAPMEGLGSLIVFATEAGRTASDNSANRNGLFTQYLLKALTAKGVSLDDAIKDVARQMAQETNRQQVPAIYGLLERPVYLFTGPVTISVASAAVPPDPGLEAWMTVKDSKDPRDFDDFIASFPQSPYVPTARLAANRLRRESSAANHPNSEAPRTGNEELFTLVVNCDLACNWKVDGEDKGTIQPGDTARSQVSPGDHVLVATTADGRNRTTQTVTGAPGTSKLVTFSLQPAPNNRAADVKTVADRGLASYNGKDYANAQADFQSACSQRDLPSCRYLAYMYEFAVGVPQDLQRSVSLLQKDCDGGDMTSCHNLGNMYQFGKGVTQDYQKAVSLFQKACTGGELHGCGGLAFMYLNGLGVAKDMTRGSQLYRQACDGGELLSCSNLAANYLSAQGVPQDDPKALTLFKSACDGNIPAGCDGLAYMYRYGRAVPVDLEKAHSLYQQACNEGFDSSCKTLVKDVADRGLASYNQKDYAKAQTDFQNACSQGDLPSCRYLAYMYEFSVGVSQDYLKSVSLLQKGCDGGEMTSCHNLANMYQNGKGVSQDYQKAFSLFQKACNGGEFKGCGGMAFIYLNGLGVSKDPSRASQLYKQACDGGDLLSCSNLAANYLSSIGVPPDDGKALALFKQACDGSIPAGCDGLAYMYRFGRGASVDLEKAHQLYQQACNAGFDSSCTTLKSFNGTTISGNPGSSYGSSTIPAVRTVADRGLASYNQKEYAGAQTDFQSACSQGDLPSCRYLAYMYEFAIGVPQDYQKSVALLKKACDGGELTGCHNLANMYQNGKGVSQDYQRALSLFQKACNGGEFKGCGGLAFMYLSGLGVSKDPTRASQLYKQSCDGGELLSCSNLGANYLSAQGVPQDDGRALVLFKQACDGGIPAGCDGLAYMYRFGRSAPIDLDKAHQLYEQACNAGFDSSCKTLTSFTGK